MHRIDPGSTIAIRSDREGQAVMTTNNSSRWFQFEGALHAQGRAEVRCDHDRQNIEEFLSPTEKPISEKSDPRPVEEVEECTREEHS
jgi:hypothetical protein